jgi:hypothetical protein
MGVVGETFHNVNFEINTFDGLLFKIPILIKIKNQIKVGLVFLLLKQLSQITTSSTPLVTFKFDFFENLK